MGNSEKTPRQSEFRLNLGRTMMKIVSVVSKGGLHGSPNGKSRNKRLQRGWLVTKPANDGVVMYFAARNLLTSAAFDSKINNAMFGDVAGRRSYGKCQLKGVVQP